MSFTKLFAEIVRDFITAGNPASGAHRPVKADLRQWGAEVEAALGGGGITNALLANMAASRIKARITGSTGAPEDATITQVLDLIAAGSTRGSILYRGASAWSALAPGTNGQVLETQGAGADPHWVTRAASGFVLLSSGTISNAATLDIILTSYTAYRGLKLFLSDIVPATDDVELWLRLSTDGGSSFDATGYSFAQRFWRDGATDVGGQVNSSVNQIRIAGAANVDESLSNGATEGGADVEITIMDQTNTGRWPKVRYEATWFGAGTTDTFFGLGGASRETAQDTDALRVLCESGNIASGQWALYGLA